MSRGFVQVFISPHAPSGEEILWDLCRTSPGWSASASRPTNNLPQRRCRGPDSVEAPTGAQIACAQIALPGALCQTGPEASCSRSCTRCFRPELPLEPAREAGSARTRPAGVPTKGAVRMVLPQMVPMQNYRNLFDPDCFDIPHVESV